MIHGLSSFLNCAWQPFGRAPAGKGTGLYWQLTSTSDGVPVSGSQSRHHGAYKQRGSHKVSGNEKQQIITHPQFLQHGNPLRTTQTSRSHCVMLHWNTSHATEMNSFTVACIAIYHQSITWLSNSSNVLRQKAFWMALYVLYKLPTGIEMSVSVNSCG